MAPLSPRRLHPGLLPGLTLVVLGFLLILHNFSVFDARRLWRFWPLLLVVFGLSKAVGSSKNDRVLGVAALVAGVALQLSTLDLLDLSMRQVLRFWPLLVIAIGVRLLIGYRSNGSLAGGLLVLVIGIVVQLKILGYITFDLWRLWPLILVVIGIMMLEKGLRRRSRPG